MSKILEDLLNNNQNSQNFQNSFPTSNNTQIPNNSESPEPSLTAILANVLTPLIPVFVSKLTGQKLPIINSVPNNQDVTQQLTPLLQSMINTQNILLQEIAVLKKNDQNIANSFQSLRLTHKKEEKEINFNPSQNLTTTYE